jgi:hypothetical protein
MEVTNLMIIDNLRRTHGFSLISFEWPPPNLAHIKAGNGPMAAKIVTERRSVGWGNKW